MSLGRILRRIYLSESAEARVMISLNVLRYTSQAVVSESGETGFGAVPVQILFCLKESASAMNFLVTRLGGCAES